MTIAVRVPNLTVRSIGAQRQVYDERPQGTIISAIVLHHTGGTNSGDYLSKWHPRPVSIHKLVPKRMPGGGPGHYQIVPDSMRAWHAGVSVWGGREDWNDFSIGVEIENLGDGRDPYTDEQYETVAQIVAYHCALLSISRRWVRLHREISGRTEGKTDPDVSFDLARMWRRVDEIEANWPYTIAARLEWQVEVP